MALVTANRLTLQATAAALAGVAVVQAIAALRTRHAQSNAIGSCVCTVAFLHYLWMRGASQTERLELRHSDWAFTCPLLLLELYLVTDQRTNGSLAVSAASALAMIALGFRAARATGAARHTLFGLGCVAFGVCAYVATHRMPRRHAPLAAAFFGLWALYPVAFLLRSNAMFDVLDVASKAGIGLYVAHRGFAAGSTALPFE